MLNPKIFRVILPVNNIDLAEKFYSELFNQKGKRVSLGRHYFSLGGVILACFDAKADGDKVKFRPNPEHIYICVDDLDKIFKQAKKLSFKELEAEIKVRPWGERSFYGKDPFGNPLCFVDEKTRFTG